MGLGGREKHLKQTEGRQFQHSNDKRHFLCLFPTHAQEEYLKLLELMRTPIHNILALLLFEKQQ